MHRYVISDHHFGHTNIIEYCDRPFTSVGEMDTTLLERHYETIEPGDLLIHLGDVAMDMQNGQETIEYFDQLGGDLLLQGNHDIGLNPDDAPFPVIDSCVLQHGDYQFYCTHKPQNVPSQWEGWTIHGHMHNNDTESYPFLAYDEQRINVSSELLDYRPIALDTLTSLLDESSAGTHLRDIEAAKQHFESAQ